MGHPKSRIGIFLSLLALLLCSKAGLPPRAEETVPPELKNVGIDAPLGKTIPLDLRFTESTGQRSSLKPYFNHDRPVIVTLVYYGCPMLCTMVLNNLSEGMKKLPWTPGKEYDVLTISIDPTETAALAVAKKQSYLDALGKPAPGWHFFVGQQPQIKALADALGFKYRYDEKQKQFAHGAGIFVLTPGGKLSQCLYGIEFPERNLRLALVEASEGKVGTVLDKLTLFCYHYDPSTHSYTVFATRLVQVGGLLTMAALGSMIGYFWVRERRERGRGAPLAEPKPLAAMPPDEKQSPTSSGV